MSSPFGVYLDNAATTFPKPETVYVATDQAARTAGGNALRGNNPLARRSAQTLQQTRASVAQLLGVEGPDRVVFAPSATIALNQVILGATLPSKPTVYVSPLEHNSVLRCVEHMRLVDGVSVQQLAFDPLTLQWKSDRTLAQFTQAPPDMVICTQASNVFGVMPDVIALARLARQCNPDVVVVIDGAQAAGLYPLDLRSGWIDYLVFSGHKSLHGPFGVAGFVVAGDRWPEPILFGGTGFQSELLALADRDVRAFEVGSPNGIAISGLQAALEWLTPSNREKVRQHAAALLVQLEIGLSGIPEVTLFRPQGPRVPILSFTLSHVSPQEAEQLLGTRGYSVRAGLHCAPLAHKLTGTIARGGTIRVSPGVFNTPDEIDQFLNAIDHICVG